MRILTFLLLLSLLICGTVLAQTGPLVEPQDTVSDYADVVEPAAKDRIKQLADEVRRTASVNLKVVVLRTIELVDSETYGRQLYDRWDIGQAKEGLERGVLLLVSILDRKVKIVVGGEVRKVIPPAAQEKIEWGVLASLSRGRFSEGVELGVTAISQLILAEWPREGPRGLKIDWQTASLPLFFLFVVTVGLTLIVGGGFIMAFSTVVGGLFGYIFLGNLGMVLGGALGFFLNYGRAGKQKGRT